MTTDYSKPITIEDIEYGLGLLAWLIKEHGPAALPLFDRLEREREIMQARERSIDHWAVKFDEKLEKAPKRRSKPTIKTNHKRVLEREYTIAVERALKVG
jgi:hypothetical protein